jgi:ADP-heptose:LPS heptosyltransferase
MKIHVTGSGWALGDSLALLPALRELRRRFPKERMEFVNTKRPELWQEFAGGTEESGRVVRFIYSGMPGCYNLTRKFAAQAGVDLVDDTPELVLTPEELARDFGVDLGRRTVAIDVWANEPARRWPVERFQELARRLLAAGWQVLECGHESIGPRARIPCSTSFLNRLSVRETAALYRRCTLWIGNDSGGFHLAASVGCPQVVFFSFVRWTERAYWSTVPLLTRSCLCASEKWDARTCNKPGSASGRCLAEIPVERVLAAVDVAVRRFGVSK